MSPSASPSCFSKAIRLGSVCPFYRSRRDWPAIELRSLEDLARLPFTEQADLARNDPPLLVLSQSAVARAVTL
jgi:phenylacetate-coenzyme A ligase PaaK-like adenylate-forming protein